MAWKRRDSRGRRAGPSALGPYVFEALEPRLLLSADPLGTAIGGALAIDSLEQQVPGESSDLEALDALLRVPAAGLGAGDTVGRDSSSGSIPPVDLTDLAHLSSFGSSSEAVVPREILFVDPRIADYQRLVAELGDGRDADVFVLEPERDGIEQISEVLAGYRQVDAVHIVSHGTEGGVQLGGAWLTQDRLAPYAAAIEAWQGSLADGADLLFYGCNLAGSEDGQALIRDLADLTGADVAASDDVTGPATLGGDWELEYRIGQVENTVASSGQVWHGVLATFTVDTIADTVDINPGDGVAEDASGNTSLRAAIMEANVLAGADSINLPSGDYVLSIAGTGENAAATGDLDITSELTITGAGAAVTVIDGGGIDRVLEIQSTGNVSMSGLAIQNGGNEVLGGGIRTVGGGGGAQLTLKEVIVQNNSASGQGSGIYNDAVLTLVDTEITGNSTPSGIGGGLLNTQEATLTGVTISGNTADSGAGIYNDIQGVALSLTNVTISGNTAAAVGGGIYTANEAYLTNVTITKNAATSAGGIHLQGGQGDAVLKNTILADNPGGNVSDTLASMTNSIDTDGSSGLTATPLVDLKLDTVLSDEGGATKTHALLAGSVAIDAGTSVGAPATDQRGYARDATTDIGAYEFGASPPVNLVVDTTSDVVDGDTSSVSNLIADQGPDGFVSLREAIIAANSTPGLDTIRFNIVGAGPHTISLNPSEGALPSITEAVVIDGTSEPDYTNAPVIEIDGSALSAQAGDNYDGLYLDTGSSGSTIRGLSLTGFTDGGAFGNAISIRSDNNSIVGNYIGVAPDGSTADPNKTGIDIVGASGNLIGGTDAVDRNVVSNNTYGAIAIHEIGADNNQIIGNYIGLAADGSTVMGNTLGIVLWTSADGNIIGGTNTGEANRIVGGGTGVWVIDTVLNTVVLGNVIYGQGQLGIDLGLAGVTVNDVGDGDGGANNLLNYPVVTDVSQDGADLDVTFSLDVPAGDYRVEFFENPNGINASGYGGGEVFLGAVTVTSNGSGTQSFSETLIGVTAAAVNTVTATATEDLGGGSFGSTSEFGPTFQNAAPVLGNTSLTISEGDSVVLTGADLSATDVDDGDPTLTFAVSNIIGGQFELTANPGAAVTSFTQAQVSANDVVFVDDGDEVGPSFEVSVSDGSLSDGPVAATVNFANVNDAPVIGNATLAAVDEDTANPPGDTVGNLFGASFVDPDAGASLAGVAVIGNPENAAEGAWEYSTDGTNWCAIGTVADDAAALVLSDTTLARFVPAADYHGTPGGLTVRALDDSYAGGFSDTAGGSEIRVNVNTSTSGGSTAIAGGTDSLGTSVTPVNDAPTAIALGNTAVDENIDTSSGYSVGTLSTTDLDAGDTATYTVVGGADMLKFSIGGGGGDEFMLTDGVLNFEAQGSYDVVVRVTDSGGLTHDEVFTITVNDLNDAPVITSAGAAGVVENTTSVTMVTATDQDVPAATMTYSLVGGADQALFGINASTGALSFNTAPDFESPADAGTDNVYEVQVQVDDGSGGTDTQTVSVTVTDSTVLDQFNAVGYSGNDGPRDWTTDWQEIGEAQNPTGGSVRVVPGRLRIGGDEVSINGRGMFREADFAGASSATLSFTYQRQLLDESGGSVTVSISADGGTNWTPLKTYNLVGTDAAPLTETIDISGFISGNMQVRFLGSGSDVESYFYVDDVEIHDGATPNSAPVITSDGGGVAAGVNVVENTSGVTTVTANDIDADIPTFSLSGGADQALFTIDPASGALSFLAPPDFETPTDAGADNIYEVEVMASDGKGGVDTQLISVTVTNTNDAPQTNTASASGPEDAASIAITLGGSDVDGTVASFSLGSLPANGTLYTDVGLSTMAATGTDYAATGEALTLYFVPDAGWNGVTGFQFAAKDDLGLADATPATATLTVTAANDAPQTSAASASGPEDAASIAITLGGSDVDGTVASFSLGSLPANGTLYTDVGLTTMAATGTDYAATGEALTLYFVPAADWNGVTSFQFAAKDDLGQADPTPAMATITVTPVNDAPMGIGLSNVDVDENIDTTGGYSVGILSASDPDSGDTLTYSIVGGADMAKFSIGGTGSNELIVSDGVLDFETQGTYQVVVRVTDAGGLTYDATRTIGVNDLNETSPAPEPLPPEVVEPLAPEPPPSVPEPLFPADNVDVTSPEEGSEASSSQEDSESHGNGSGTGTGSSEVQDSEEADLSLPPFDDLQGQPIETGDGPPAAKEVLTGTVESVMKAYSIAHPVVGPALRHLGELAGMGEDRPAFYDPVSLVETGGFLHELDSVRDDIADDLRFDKTVVGTTIVASTGLSVGYVVWLVRGGALLTSLLSSLPAWRLVDPLPILAYVADRPEDDQDEEETLESLVKERPRRAETGDGEHSRD